jgi:hypothetical protein
MRPTALLPLRRKSCYGSLWRLKIHRPRPGLNPITLGVMASMLSTRLPRVLVSVIMMSATVSMSDEQTRSDQKFQNVSGSTGHTNESECNQIVIY